jgi:hypothetical protein
MLEELQSLSDVNKKRILIIATIIIMVIVVSIWISYLNSIVAGPAQQAAQATSTVASAFATDTLPTVTPAQTSGPSIWQNIENWFGSLLSNFGKPSQYTIQPQSN